MQRPELDQWMDDSREVLREVDRENGVSHQRHLDILRDITALAILNASDPTHPDDMHDAEETISLCENWVEAVA